MSGIYPASDRLWRPWKNGGGETAEVLAHPYQAGFDDFAWRLSIARVDADGPFSVFPGVDRVLAVIEGGPMRLDINGDIRVLDAQAPPLAFAGDAPCHAEMSGGALLDFNLMLRRPGQGRMQRGAITATSAGFALLLQPCAGLARLDLVDLARLAPGLRRALSGCPALIVTIG